ncbi:unnamed protein product [Tetraodon nigroviridis]|uniref:(spotted green pufferfish) hypothetical protein n=1 Tax=Tetraodon nigroviridis TaxID=99883 RepID=Q4S9Y4_TETNG|nr:unnamed protein product [Tetraodon nigroviridis]
MEDSTGRFGLKRQVCQSLRQVLQLRLQERRSRVELLRQGTMARGFIRLLGEPITPSQSGGRSEMGPAPSGLTTPSEGRPAVDQSRRTRPGSCRAAHLQQKRARLGGEVNKRMSHRSAPTFRHILPLPYRIQPATKETQPPKVSDESCDEDSSCSLSPGLWTNPGPPALSTPRVLVIRQVTELKSELKRQGLAVSGPKSQLIERLKFHQELKTGFRNTSFPTAGGTTRSGAKRGAFIPADSSPAGAPHQVQHYQTFLNLQPGDGNNPVFDCKIK